MKHILVVEDDASIAEALTYALEKEGYRTTHCRAITDALRVTAASAFDLALLDMQLPDGSGREMASRLKSDHIPIL